MDNRGATVTAGQYVPVSDIASGKLQFTPASDTYGSNYANFSFQVQDDGGTWKQRAWITTGPLANPRFVHTATPLPDGQVLIAGGFAMNYLHAGK